MSQKVTRISSWGFSGHVRVSPPSSKTEKPNGKEAMTDKLKELARRTAHKVSPWMYRKPPSAWLQDAEAAILSALEEAVKMERESCAVICDEVLEGAREAREGVSGCIASIIDGKMVAANRIARAIRERKP